MTPRNTPFPRGECEHALNTRLAAQGTSAYLGYVLYAILHDFCLVCVSTYVINIGIFAYTIQAYAVGAAADAERDDRKSR